MNKYLEKYKGSPLIATIICIDKSKDCVYVKTNLGIYGIIPVNRKSIKSPTEAIVNGSKVAIGDSIVVEYSSIQDYFTETTFNYLGKDTNGIRKIKYSDFAILLDSSKYFELYKKILEYNG